MELETFHLFNFTRVEAPEIVVAPERVAMMEDYLERGWHEIDTFSHTAAKLHGRVRYIADTHLLDADVRKRDPFYQEFCRDWGLGGFVAWTFDLMGERWAYTLMPRDPMSLTPETLALLDVFRPAADRACTLASTISATRARSVAEGLELAGRPTAVLDHTGRVAFMTPAAEALLGHGFSVQGGYLSSDHRESDAQLRKLAALAGRALRPHLVNFAIHRRDGRRPIVAMPMHAGDHGLEGLPGARVLLMLADLHGEGVPGVRILSDAFGLSAREAELAKRLLAGDSLEEAAAAMQISVSTVRQMVKRVFAKTNTSRQAELVSLLAKAVG
jgi:DNA-binding CsgD family transcriptional regulator